MKLLKRICAVFGIALSLAGLGSSNVSAETLNDLKKLDIICFAPAYLPAGFKLQGVSISNDDAAGEFEDKNIKLPLYSIAYGGKGGATFTIESAREGIGDRNLMEEEDAEEAEIATPLGPFYIIYRPKGKTGKKTEIRTNWVNDANMNAELAKNPEGHPLLGRYHGFSGTEITLEEFTKIVQSLKPVKEEKAAKPDQPAPSPAASPTTSPAK